MEIMGKILNENETLIANPFTLEVIKTSEYSPEKFHPLHVILTDYAAEKKWHETIVSAKKCAIIN